MCTFAVDVPSDEKSIAIVRESNSWPIVQVFDETSAKSQDPSHLLELLPISASAIPIPLRQRIGGLAGHAGLAGRRIHNEERIITLPAACIGRLRPGQLFRRHATVLFVASEQGKVTRRAGLDQCSHCHRP